MTSITGCSAVGSAGGLGPSGRGFEPLHSDQKLSEISDFRELFLFLVYCGARGEVGIKQIRQCIVIFTKMYYIVND